MAAETRCFPVSRPFASKAKPSMASDREIENENSPEASATICETLAQQLASYVVEREAEMHPERFSDAAMYFARQQQLLPHFVIALQAGLVNR